MHQINPIFQTHNIQSHVSTQFDPSSKACIYPGDCRDLLASLPKSTVQLVVSSPPYNIGKEYEKKTSLENYIALQKEILHACYDVLSDNGSLCWQVGNYIVSPGEIMPLDIALNSIFQELGMKLRNRIIWHFGSGLHCKRTFSRRYETVLWYTKGDDYIFNLDAVRVPQKYPGKKHWKGEKKGKLTCNPLGKNPDNFWSCPGDTWDITNVKGQHPEKTAHPCQFPIALIERLVLALTNPGDLVVDPFCGAASAVCAAVLHDRRGCGAEINEEYIKIANERVDQAIKGTLKRVPLRYFNEKNA